MSAGEETGTPRGGLGRDSVSDSDRDCVSCWTQAEGYLKGVGGASLRLPGSVSSASSTAPDSSSLYAFGKAAGSGSGSPCTHGLQSCDPQCTLGCACRSLGSHAHLANTSRTSTKRIAVVMFVLPPADRSQSRGGGTYAGAGASVSSASVSAATSAPGTQALTLPVLPFFVTGESMGGAVAILAAHSRAFPFDGVVLRAPMCGIDEGLVPPSRVVAVLDRMGRYCPAAPIVPGCVWGVSS